MEAVSGSPELLLVEPRAAREAEFEGLCPLDLLVFLLVLTLWSVIYRKNPSSHSVVLGTLDLPLSCPGPKLVGMQSLVISCQLAAFVWYRDGKISPLHADSAPLGS